METIAWIAIYVVGYVVSYLSWRYVDRKEWTVRLRTIALILSLLSWLSVLAMGWMFLLESTRKGLKNESKAKW